MKMQKNLKHSWKRLLACLLAVVMLVGVAPMADIGGTAIKASAISQGTFDAKLNELRSSYRITVLGPVDTAEALNAGASQDLLRIMCSAEVIRHGRK